MGVCNKLLLVCFVAFFLIEANAQSLDTAFYSRTCPKLDTIVREETAKFISRAPSLAPALLRMHFHDCFVRGCDASILLNSTRTLAAEKDSIPNQSLRGYHVIDAVKAAVEKQCPRNVSCADILALTARAAVVQIKGPSWPVPLGRRDGLVSNSTEAIMNLPPPFFNITQLINNFASKGLNVKDLVVLSGGGHTIGISHCPSFSNRIYNFTGRNDVDPSMDPNYAAALRRKCPPNDNTTIVQMDPGSSMNFDTAYFSIVRKRRGLFEADAALLNNTETRRYVLSHLPGNATAEAEFLKDFADSMVKMGGIGVLTGSAGQIRRVCSVVN